LVSIAKVYYHENWENQLSLLATSIQVQRRPPPDDDDVEEGVMVGIEPLAVPTITDVDVQQQIVLLNPCPPPWSIVPSCTSDWLEKQKVRQELGLKPTSRKDRRRLRRFRLRSGTRQKICQIIDKHKNLIRKESNNQKTITASSTVARTLYQQNNNNNSNTNTDGTNEICNETDNNDNILVENITKIDPMDYVRLHPLSCVVAAVGYGPGNNNQDNSKKRQRQLLRRQQQKRRRRSRRRRTLILVAAGCVGIVFIGAVGYYYKYGSATAVANPFFSYHSSSNSNHRINGSGNGVGASTEGVSSSSSSSSYPASANANTIPDLVDEEIVPTMILPRLNLHTKKQQQQQQMTSSSSLSSSRVSTTNTRDLMSSTIESGLLLESLTDSTTATATATTPPTTSRSTTTATTRSKDNDNNTNNVMGAATSQPKLFLKKLIQHLYGFCRRLFFFHRVKKNS